MPQYNRYLREDNRHEPQLVRESGYVKGGEARVLAGGARINAYPGPHAPARDRYTFATDSPPKLSYGLKDGKRVLREVYWPEGSPGVVEFPAENRIGIPATVTTDPLP